MAPAFRVVLPRHMYIAVKRLRFMPEEGDLLSRFFCESDRDWYRHINANSPLNSEYIVCLLHLH